MRKQKLSNFQIEPEELLLDRGDERADASPGTKVESHIRSKNFWVLFFISLLMTITLLGRAFWLDVINGEYYAKRSRQNSVKTYSFNAMRGIIYDRDRRPITENIPAFNLLLIPKFLPEDGKGLDGFVEKISKILGQNPEDLKNQILAFDKNLSDPVILETGLKPDQVIMLEIQSADLPGVIIDKTYVRQYNDGPAFFHLLGYLGKISRGDMKRDAFYTWTDFIGVSGLESYYEKALRGAKGTKALLLDSKGAVINQVVADKSTPGDNLVLALDIGLQKILYQALEETKTNWGAPGAGVVVLNPQNGEVLALVSLPSADNNVFNQGISSNAFKKIADDPGRPLFNRVLSGLYPSGSTIKPLIASAALQENVISPNKLIDDTLGYITIQNQYDPGVVYTYRDWKAHGFVDMKTAIAVSANVYFYTIGGGYKNIKGLGIERIVKYLKQFGLGEALGIDLAGEKKGLVPTPEWKKAVKKETWFLGDTYNVSIGQGDVTVTPLQMASAIAAIANGGTLWRPRIALEIEDHNGALVQKFKPQIIRDNFINSENLKIVREGMRDAVHFGSARFLNDLPFEAAGKTGTAQFGSRGKTNAWFVGFAPYENPQLAIAIVVDEVGEGSTAAVPVAKEVFRRYFEQQKNMVK